MQWGAPLPDAEQALARVESQDKPHPLQFMNDGSSRPLLPAVTLRPTHAVPQQRCDELHEGEQAEGPLSMPPLSRTAPSIGVPEQDPIVHVCPSAHTLPQAPQLLGSIVTGVQAVTPALFMHASSKPLQALPGLRLFEQPASIRPKDIANAATIRIEVEDITSSSPNCHQVTNPVSRKKRRTLRRRVGSVNLKRADFLTPQRCDGYSCTHVQQGAWDMRRATNLGVLLVLLMGCGGTTVATETTPSIESTLPWVRFASNSDGFSVEMPGTPAESQQETGPAPQTIHTKLFILDLEADIGAGFIVTVTRGGRFAAPGASAEDIYNLARDGALAGTHATLISETAQMVAGLPGREVQMSMDGGQTQVREHLVFVDGTLYSVVFMAGAHGRSPTGDVAAHYLESFRLVHTSSNAL